MSKRSRSSPEAVELEMNLNRSPAWSSSSTTEESASSAIVSSSSSSSDMSWEGEEGRYCEIIRRSMALVGCPGCFMYVMLTEESSQCPKCKNNVFLHFFNHQHGCKN